MAAKLWLLTQDEIDGYDTYDSCVVVAPDERLARELHPSGALVWGGKAWVYLSDRREKPSFYSDWATDPANVTATELGLALDDNPRVVCASFNAG